jgi:RNA polymerase sigma factor (sigma-70 family)
VVFPVKPEDWNNLAGLAQAGDKRAYESLLKHISVYARRVLVGKVPPEAIDDIVQDVLISVHKSFKTYRVDRAFKPWLFAIISFRRTDFLRRHYAHQAKQFVPLDDMDITPPIDTPNPSQTVELKDIQTALNTFSPVQRRIFERVKVEGHSINDVANETGMNPSAVKVSAHRTLKKLRHMLRGNVS